MQAAFETTQPVKPAPRKLQFSIKSLLIGTTAIAVFIGLCMIPPAAAILLIALYALVITACIVTAFSGRGWIRPFAITGGLYMLTSLLLILNSHPPSAGAVAIVLLVNLIIAAGVGITSSIAHGFLAKRGGYVPVPNVPVLKNWLHNEPIEIND